MSLSILITWLLNNVWYCREKLHVYHSWELKGLADKLIPLDSLSKKKKRVSPLKFTSQQEYFLLGHTRSGRHQIFTGSYFLLDGIVWF